MNSEAFDHAVRAAGSILGENEVLVIGSQALHGSMSSPLPIEAERSVEADVAALDDPDDHKADLIDGAIGEGSMFHETFGYYVQGVSRTTAVLPTGWEGRAVRYQSPATNGVVAICPEIHDLWLSKAVARRPKDLEFCGALIKRGLVDGAVLNERVDDLPVSGARIEGVRGLLQRLTSTGRTDPG